MDQESKTSNQINEDLGNWQASDGAFWFLLSTLMLMNILAWSKSLTLALDGHQGAIENLLDSFGFSAVAIALLSVGYKKPRLLVVGGLLVGSAFYASSVFLPAVLNTHNVGTAIRVGAISSIVLAISGWRLALKFKSPA